MDVRVYAEVLARLPVSSVRCSGYAEDPEGRDAWLFLEESVAGEYSPALEEHRRLAGRWLGLLHTSAARSRRRGAPARPGAGPLPGVPGAGARRRHEGPRRDSA